MQQQPQQPAVDKLVIAVVRNDDANTIVEELVKRRIGNTRINTAGGVLRRGNVTLLVGVPASQVDETLDVIRENVSGQPLTGRGQTGQQSRRGLCRRRRPLRAVVSEREIRASVHPSTLRHAQGMQAQDERVAHFLTVSNAIAAQLNRISSTPGLFLSSGLLYFCS